MLNPSMIKVIAIVALSLLTSFYSLFLRVVGSDHNALPIRRDMRSPSSGWPLEHSNTAVGIVAVELAIAAVLSVAYRAQITDAVVRLVAIDVIDLFGPLIMHPGPNDTMCFQALAEQPAGLVALNFYRIER
jgi:hypothetical protein